MADQDTLELEQEIDKRTNDYKNKIGSILISRKLTITSKGKYVKSELKELDKFLLLYEDVNFIFRIGKMLYNEYYSVGENIKEIIKDLEFIESYYFGIELGTQGWGIINNDGTKNETKFATFQEMIITGFIDYVVALNKMEYLNFIIDENFAEAVRNKEVNNSIPPNTYDDLIKQLWLVLTPKFIDKKFESSFELLYQNLRWGRLIIWKTSEQELLHLVDKSIDFGLLKIINDQKYDFITNNFMPDINKPRVKKQKYSRNQLMIAKKRPIVNAEIDLFFSNLPQNFSNSIPIH